MKETIKDLAKSTVISIGMAMAIFCLVGIVFDVGYKGNFSQTENSHCHSNTNYRALC